LIHLLELKDLLKNSIETQVTQWKPTAALLVRDHKLLLIFRALIPPLQKIFRKYIWALLLLPATQYYGGTVEITIIVSHILSCTRIFFTLTAIQDAMRSSSAKGLPTADAVDNEALVREIARELSIARSQFKKTVDITLNISQIEHTDTQ
jgi:hypothetical protein